MTASDNDPIRSARDELAETGVDGRVQAAPGEQSGDVIDRYKLLQEIGEGGMGTVWMAEQAEPVKRMVALKIIKLGMDTKEVVVRFEAERQALALMDHANIAKVLDGGATEHGRPFFVMELVRGVPITEYCDTAKLGLRERLELFTKVCEAIQHAHHKGIIHRDIKPSNVMVTLYDGVPVPKVIDFGIAKATSAELTQKTLFTQYGNMIGTPEYMAPEQAEMSGLDIDTRGDVYSLGVLLYELLTGSKPFEIAKVLEKGYQELLRAIREDEPAKPSTRVSTMAEQTPIARAHANVDKLSNRLRGDLDWIVMRAMEKDRTRRYETANGFAADVQRYLQGDAVQAAPPSSLYKLRKFLGRRKKTVLSVVVITVLFVAGAVGSSIGWWEAYKSNQALIAANGEKDRALAQEVEERKRAEKAEEAERQRADELTLVTRFQSAQLKNLDGVRMGASLREALLAAVPADRREALAKELRGIEWAGIALGNIESQILLPSAEVVRSQFADQPVVKARLLMTVADALSDVTLMVPALPILHEVVALEENHDEVPVELGLRAKMTIARILSIQSKFDEALSVAGAVHRSATDELGECGVTGYANYVMGSVHGMRGEHAKGLPYLERAIEMLTEHRGVASSSALDARRWLGNSLSALGRTDEAIAMQREALSLAESAGPGIASTAMVLRRSLVLMMQNAGRHRDCLAMARQALADCVELFGSRSKLWVMVATSLSWSLIEVGELDEAEQLLQVALQRAQELEFAKAPLVLNVRQKIAWLREKRGDESAIGNFVDSAVEFGRKADSDDLVIALLNRGRSERDRGKLGEARASYQEALDEAMRRVGREHPLTFHSLRGLGVTYRAQNKLEDAERLLREALELATKAWGDDHELTRDAINSLSVVLQAQQKDGEAARLAKRFYESSVRVDGPRHGKTLVARMNYALCVFNVGKFVEAVEEMQATHAAMSEVLGAKHSHTLRGAMSLGDMLYYGGRFEELRDVADATLEHWPEAALRDRPSWLVVRRHQALARLRLRDREGVEYLRKLLDDERALRTGQSFQRLAQLAGFALDNGWAQVALDATTELIEERRQAWNGDWRAHIWQLAQATARGLLGDYAAQEAVVLREIGLLREEARKGNRLPLPVQVRDGLRRVVQFYEAWHAADPTVGAAEKAATWRQLVDETK